MGEIRCAYNVENDCRGLLFDEPRKSIEPLAVRSLQCFLKNGEWDHLALRDHHQRTAGKALAAEPDPDGLGTLDTDLFLPEKWGHDRERCRPAGIPDDLRYAPKWRQAFFQYVRARENGLAFD